MVKGNLLVIGGGIAGITSALEGAAKGCKVYLIEKSSNLGGKAIKYCCKATDKCNKCSTCLVSQGIRGVQENPRIEVFFNWEVSTVTEVSNGFNVKLKGAQGEFSLEVDAIIVAIGFRLYDASRKGEYGYGRYSNVITALELEGIIRNKGTFTKAFGPIKNIGFLQCVGSRELHEGFGYCSTVCCMYAVRLARLIRSEVSDIGIKIFHTDLQTIGRNSDKFLVTCEQKEKIEFIRGIPAKIYPAPPDQLNVRYANTLSGEIVEEKFDLMVLSAAIRPANDSKLIADILDLTRDRWGFLEGSSIDAAKTRKEGIFLAGVCQAPKNIQQSILQAKVAVSKALNFMQTKENNKASLKV